MSTAAHASILAALFMVPAPRPPPPGPSPIEIALVDLPVTVAPAAAQAPTPTPEPKPAPPHPQAKPAAAHRAAVAAPVRPAETAPMGAQGVGLTDAQLAGAASADSGPTGRPCDMARRLQSALRRDPLVQAAVARASGGRAIMIWDGDWVQSGGEDGKGLAAVREAVMWEVAFAPPACRAEPMRGLILLSMNEGPGAARLAVGQGDWRWSDLLRSGRAGD